MTRPNNVVIDRTTHKMKQAPNVPFWRNDHSISMPNVAYGPDTKLGVRLVSLKRLDWQEPDTGTRYTIFNDRPVDMIPRHFESMCDALPQYEFEVVFGEDDESGDFEELGEVEVNGED